MNEAKPPYPPELPYLGGGAFGATSAIGSAISELTLWDYFAGHAMQGLMANPEHHDDQFTVVASWAYRQADAMMERRAK